MNLNYIFLIFISHFLQAPVNYNYYYKVQDDYSYVDFGANEKRKGEYTDGYYYVVLPDGRTQKVKYYVDGYSGYVAEVTYEGEAKYPENNKPYGYNTYNNKNSYKMNEPKSYEKKKYDAPVYNSYEPKPYSS